MGPFLTDLSVRNLFTIGVRDGSPTSLAILTIMESLRQLWNQMGWISSIVAKGVRGDESARCHRGLYSRGHKADKTKRRDNKLHSEEEYLRLSA